MKGRCGRPCLRHTFRSTQAKLGPALGCSVCKYSWMPWPSRWLCWLCRRGRSRGMATRACLSKDECARTSHQCCDRASAIAGARSPLLFWCLSRHAWRSSHRLRRCPNLARKWQPPPGQESISHLVGRPYIRFTLWAKSSSVERQACGPSKRRASLYRGPRMSRGTAVRLGIGRRSWPSGMTPTGAHEGAWRAAAMRPVLAALTLAPRPATLPFAGMMPCGQRGRF